MTHQPYALRNAVNKIKSFLDLLQVLSVGLETAYSIKYSVSLYLVTSYLIGLRDAILINKGT